MTGSSPGAPHFPPRAALFLAVLAISTGAIFARRAAAADPAVVALWRCALATAVCALFGRGRVLGAWTRLSGRDRALALAGGVLLGLHFQTWIASLALTSIASSVVLVSTTPLWVALLAPWLSQDVLPRNMGRALVLCFAGLVAIGGADLAAGAGSPNAWAGDGLALLGALCAALYLLVSRHLRAHLELLPELVLIYGAATLWLLGVCALRDLPLAGYDRSTTLALVGLAAIPQLVGHSTFHWALRWVSAPLVALAVLGEPVLASALGYLFEGERVGLATWVGGGLLLAGIATAVRGEHRARPAPGGDAH